MDGIYAPGICELLGVVVIGLATALVLRPRALVQTKTSSNDFTALPRPQRAPTPSDVNVTVTGNVAAPPQPEGSPAGLDPPRPESSTGLPVVDATPPHPRRNSALARHGMPAAARSLAVDASASPAELRWRQFLDRVLDESELDLELRSTIDACIRGLDESLTLSWLMSSVVGVAMDKAHRMGSKREPVVRAIADAVQMALVRGLTAPSPRTRAALFFPSNVAFRYVLGLLEGASRSLDICVYTITDRQITERILAAHERNVRVRIATDDKKAFDQGSAVFALAQAGIPTVVSEQDDGWTPEGGGGVRERHMHHKFAVVDGATLLTGSFNWTVAAHQRNSENLLVTDEPYFVAKYSGEFERVWDSCRRDNRLGTNAAARRIQALYRGRSFRRSFSKESFSRLVLGEGDGALHASGGVGAPASEGGGEGQLPPSPQQLVAPYQPPALRAHRPNSGAAAGPDAPRSRGHAAGLAAARHGAMPQGSPERSSIQTRNARASGSGADAPGSWRTPPRSPPLSSVADPHVRTSLPGADAGPGTLMVSREPEPRRGSDAGMRPTVDDMPMPGRAPAQPRPQ